MIKFPVFFANIYPLYRMYWAARVLEIPARGFDSYFYGRDEQRDKYRTFLSLSKIFDAVK
jgi:hypothetical protein